MAGNRPRRQRHFLVERRPRLTGTWHVEVRAAKKREAEEIVAGKNALQRFFAEFRVRQQDTLLLQ